MPFLRHAASATRSRGIGSHSAVPAAIVAAFVLLPIGALLILSLGDSSDVWRHLYTTVLPRSLSTTALLLAGVGAVTLAIGTMTAWLISRYRFFGSDILSWLLVMPLSIPTYVAAYCAIEAFGFTGPFQETVRWLGGYRAPSEYWFPEIRSIPGAVVTMSLVLYPYVYLPCRLAFSRQAGAAIESARLLGAGNLRVFARIALPLARPAAAAGVTLAMLETLNDIGAVEILGVRSLSFTIYDTWLNRSSLAGAAQIACVTLLFVALLIWAERVLRRDRRYAVRGTVELVKLPLAGAGNVLAFVACAAPVVLGLGVPLAILVRAALHRLDALSDYALAEAATNSLIFAAATGVMAVACGLAIAKSDTKSATGSLAARLALLGYALPGSVLAIGMLYAVTTFDNKLDAIMRSWAGLSTGLLISGTVLILIYAATVRFLSVAYGAIDTGRAGIGEHVIWASRALGRSAARTAISVELPLLARAMAAGALLVFVDTMKELPATLILRPFGFSTLATVIYEKASQGRFEEGAFAALFIIAIGAAALLAMGGVWARFEAGQKERAGQ